MPTFQDTREHTEQKVMVHLLSEIERNPSFTQRSLASELGIALGLMNQYLKRCVTKGWVRASQVSPKRITYFLTPDGFKEKSFLVKDYLSRSLHFYRNAKSQCEEAFHFCNANGWTKIALVGDGDLADIAKLVANGTSINVEVVNSNTDLNIYDAAIITNVLTPQETYSAIISKMKEERVLTLRLLHISKVRS